MIDIPQSEALRILELSIAAFFIVKTIFMIVDGIRR